MNFILKKNSANIPCEWYDSRSSWKELTKNVLTNRKVFFYASRHTKTTLRCYISDGGNQNRFEVNYICSDFMLQVNEKENPFGGIYREVYFRVSKKQGIEELKKYLTEALRQHIPHIDEYTDIAAEIIFTHTENMKIDIADGVTEFALRPGDKIFQNYSTGIDIICHNGDTIDIDVLSEAQQLAVCRDIIKSATKYVNGYGGLLQETTEALKKYLADENCNRLTSCSNPDIMVCGEDESAKETVHADEYTIDGEEVKVCCGICDSVYLKELSLVEKIKICMDIMRSIVDEN